MRDYEWVGKALQPEVYMDECPKCDCEPGIMYSHTKDKMMAEALQAFGGQIGARPTYADFYKHIDSVFQCIWAAQGSMKPTYITHLEDAETALQALDDYIYERLGKGDL